MENEGIGQLILEQKSSSVRRNNYYEISKAQAEELVEADTRFGRRIFRPSIVIGHSRTLGATNFTGMYGFLRKLEVFHGLMQRTQAGLMQRKAFHLITSSLSDGEFGRGRVLGIWR